jgi:radical SAM superfamily enzyme YgiQ (UPF0313 family)
MEKYKIEYIWFYDENFLTDKSRVEKICELMKKNNIHIEWSFASRADSIDLSILKKIKEVGCKIIFFGFESGSQRILNVLEKGTTIEQNQKAVDLCKETGITVIGYFIMGNPTEAIEDLEATRLFIEKNNSIFPVFHFLTPYPGTKLWELYKNKSLLKDLDWSSFRFNKQGSSIPKFSPYINMCDSISRNELEIIFNQFKQIEKSRFLIGVKYAVLHKLQYGFLRLLWLIKFGLKHPHTLKK